MVHVIGSVMDLFKEVFQLLDENALLKPLQGTNIEKTNVVVFTL